MNNYQDVGHSTKKTFHSSVRQTEDGASWARCLDNTSKRTTPGNRAKTALHRAVGRANASTAQSGLKLPVGIDYITRCSAATVSESSRSCRIAVTVQVTNKSCIPAVLVRQYWRMSPVSPQVACRLGSRDIGRGFRWFAVHLGPLSLCGPQSEQVIPLYVTPDKGTLWTGAADMRRGRAVETVEGCPSRCKEKQSVLSALLPGAEIRDAKHPVLVNTDTSRETVQFNIGGTIFETYRSTLHKLPHSPLADEAFLQNHFRREQKQYFFDRDSEVFGAMLNYLRTGELHLPTHLCGPAAKAELEFWGLEEDEIEECCWTNYSTWTATLNALRKLEKDRQLHMPGSEEEFRTVVMSEGIHSNIRRLQVMMWDLINMPQSSIWARVFGYLSLAFVVISIFSFIAHTHEMFRVNITDVDLHNITDRINVTGDDVNVKKAVGTTLHSQSTDKRAIKVVDDVSSALLYMDDTHPAILYIDAVCLAFFSMDLLLRLILSPQRCKLLFLPKTIFDILALVPDVVEFGFKIFHPAPDTLSNADVISFLRLLRVFRILRLIRHFPGLWILFYTLKASIKELLLLLIFLIVGMLFFASLIYYADDRQIFTSIPKACWWSIITMTTVGYGDMYPTTSWGYVVGSMTALCGLLVIGFTVPVLVNNFILYYHHTQYAIGREEARARRANRRKTTQHTSTAPAKQIQLTIDSLAKEEITANNLRKAHLPELSHDNELSHIVELPC